VHLRVGDAADVARRSNAARQYGGLVQLRGLQKYERGVETGRTDTKHEKERVKTAQSL
jgi:hypothetical protein